MLAAIRWSGAAMLLGACSLEAEGAASTHHGLPDAEYDAGLLDAPPPDAVPEASADASDDGSADAPGDAPPTCQATGACTQALPPGWSPVAVPGDPAAACGAGFTPKDLLLKVDAAAGACDCACNVSKSPTCDVGSIQRYVSNDAACGSPGVLLTVSGSACTAISPITISAYAKGAPIGPSGGTCSATAVEDKGKVNKALLRACGSAACAESTCQGQVAGGFSTCVIKSGNEATCPAGFTAKRLLAGEDFSLGCSACSCDVNGPSKCTGATLSYYSDNACNKLVTSNPVNGQCNANQNAGSNANHFKYSATLQQSCAATGAKAAAPTLSQLSTICCK